MKIKYILLFLLSLQTRCAIEPADLTPEDFVLPDLPVIQLIASELRCPVAGCQYNPKRKRYFERHIRYHTGDKPYACTVRGCTYRATVKEGLQRHNRMVHLKLRPYKCDICGHASKTKNDCTVHMRTHTGERPFACPIQDCPYRAARKGNISSHLRRHTGDMKNKHED